MKMEQKNKNTGSGEKKRDSTKIRSYKILNCDLPSV